jgi:hypothetical protein
MAYIDNTSEEERARALAQSAPGAPGASGSPVGGGANVPAAAPANTAASGTGFIPLQTYFGAQPLQDQSALTEQVGAAVQPVTPNWEVVGPNPPPAASPGAFNGRRIPPPRGGQPIYLPPGVYDRADYAGATERATAAHDALNKAQSGTDYTEHVGENGYTQGMGAFDTALAQRSGGQTWADLEAQFGAQLDANSSGNVPTATGKPVDPNIALEAKAAADRAAAAAKAEADKKQAAADYRRRHGNPIDDLGGDVKDAASAVGNAARRIFNPFSW